MHVQDAMCAVSAIVGADHTLAQAAARMVQNNTGAAVVMDHSLPGPAVVTERDLLRAVAQGLDPQTEHVADHMTSRLVTAGPTWSVEKAGDLMVQHGVRHVLVFDGPDLVGILSMRDVVRVCGLSTAGTAMAG
ncbi:MAG: CBS domain-containing protein [Thermoleophilia bacterium]